MRNHPFSIRSLGVLLLSVVLIGMNLSSASASVITKNSNGSTLNAAQQEFPYLVERCWLLPPGTIPDNVYSDTGWPQTAAPCDLVLEECGGHGWLQHDTYKIENAEEEALLNRLDEAGIMYRYEDGPIYDSHDFIEVFGPSEEACNPTEIPQTPTVPVETPTVPVETPTVPVETPTVPAETPTVPAETPTVPAETPTVPAETPTVPAETPTVPVETPAESPSPTVPPANPTAPVVSNLPSTGSGDEAGLATPLLFVALIIACLVGMRLMKIRSTHNHR